MTTMTISIGGFMGAEQGQGPFSHTLPHSIARVERSASTNIAGIRRERPEAEPAEGSEDRMSSLQQRICELLIKNQRLRMSLDLANAADRGDQDDRSV